VTNKSGIDVNPRERRIRIPESREVTRDTLETLIVHELGVHFTRSVMGEQSTLGPLRTGLAGYMPSEEGLGVVMEQAWRGKIDPDVGVPLYISAGAAFVDHKSWPELFRMNQLFIAFEKIKDGDSEINLTETQLDTAYTRTQRIYRGTDELPMTKDTAYYNGNMLNWEMIELYHELFPELAFLFLSGKFNVGDPEQLDAVVTAGTREGISTDPKNGNTYSTMSDKRKKAIASGSIAVKYLVENPVSRNVAS
jgi:hypothetical protein